MPHHIIVDREGLPPGQQDPEGFKEDEDFVELGGIQVSRVLIAFKIVSAALQGSSYSAPGKDRICMSESM